MFNDQQHRRAETSKAHGPQPRTALNTGLSTEIASLRERLVCALAETENIRRQGERRVQDAQQYAITNFARELLQVVDNLRRATAAGTADAEAKKGIWAVGGRCGH